MLSHELVLSHYDENFHFLSFKKLSSSILSTILSKNIANVQTAHLVSHGFFTSISTFSFNLISQDKNN